MTNSNNNYYAHAFLYRGSTLIGSSVATGKGGGNGIHSQSIERLDSPNTTSSTTYTLRLAAEGNTAKPATPNPMTVPPPNETFNAFGKLVLAA